MRLEKWQRNAVFEAVVGGGLDPGECIFEYDEDSARITHVPSKSYYLLEGNPGQYNASGVVGDSPTMPSESFTWTKVEERFGRWAKQVKTDMDTPDLWADLQRKREFLTGSRYDDIENTRFTSEDQAEIAESLRQAKEFLKKTTSLSEAQIASVDTKLDFILAAADRLGRKDWLLLASGVMFSVIVADLVPPEVVRYLFVVLLESLAHLFFPSLPPLLGS